jgi:hypothetical protein
MRIAFPIVLTLSLLGCAGTDEVADTSDEDLVSSPQAASPMTLRLMPLHIARA